VFTLLHTNDLHNHLTDDQARRLADRRQTLGTSGLLLDAGDAIASGNITFRPGGEPILERMTQIGYDAMTVGNREFHVWRCGFHSKLFRADFPVLCANIRPTPKIREEGNGEREKGEEGKPDTEEMPVRPYVVFEPDPGWRVGVIGLTVPMVTERMLARKISAYVFDNPVQTAAQIVPRLRSELQLNLLVVLTHIGIAQDRVLAAAVPGIDIIIGGHTHVVLEHGERVGDTLIAQAGSFGRFLGRIEVDPDTPPGWAPGVKAVLEAL